MSSSPAPQARSGDPSSTVLNQPSGPASASKKAAEAASPWARLQQWLDRLLVLDVFLVIAAALWFGVAVLLHARGVEAPLQLFERLWEPLFTPAIGLLMAAALLSGALSWWRRRAQKGDRGT